MLRRIFRGIRLPLAAAVALSLAGCGFHPLYGEDGAGNSIVHQLADMQIEAPGSEVGRALKYNLLDSVAPGGVAPANATYKLVLGINSYTQDSAVQQDSAVTRASYVLVASFALYKNGEKTRLLYSFARSRSSYNRVESEYANLAAEQDALKRTADAVADDIRLQLSIYFDRQANKQAAADKTLTK